MYQILPGHVRMRAEVRSSQVSPSGLKGKGDPTQTWSLGLPGTKKGVVGDCQKFSLHWWENTLRSTIFWLVVQNA